MLGSLRRKTEHSVNCSVPLGQNQRFFRLEMLPRLWPERSSRPGNGHWMLKQLFSPQRRKFPEILPTHRLRGEPAGGRFIFMPSDRVKSNILSVHRTKIPELRKFNAYDGNSITHAAIRFYRKTKK